MIDGLKPYTEMKDSGVEWLCEVPAHWKVRRLKFVLSERVEKGSPDEPLLTATQSKGVVRKDQYESRTVLAMKDLHLLKLVHVDDFVISLRSFQGGIEFAREKGIISPAYTVLYPNDCETHGYLSWLFKSAPFIQGLSLFVTGIRQGQNIDYEKLSRSGVPLPSPDEQTAIVRFLDHADRRIRRAIATKQKLLRLLGEQRRAIIHHAVTRGIDPDVRLKPSGIEWLGDVPDSWRIGRVKSELRNLNTRRVPLSSSERGNMTQRTYDYYGASGVIDKVDDYLFDDDLILIAEDGANLVLRNLPLAIIARGRFWVNNHAHILRPLKGSLEYFAALLECINYQPWITGAAQPKLTKDRLMAISIPVPSEDEQNEIAAWIEANTKNLRTSAQRVKREIELLREYRTRLVSDVVTGRIDVRKAAESMPEIIECGDSECGEAEEYEDDSLENVTTEDQAE